MLTSTTATLLLSAFETSSVFPSGDSPSEFGVDVGGACGNRFIEICSIASRENVSNTQTDDVLPDATKRRWPSADSVIAFGCSPVATRSIAVKDRASKISMADPPQRET